MFTPKRIFSVLLAVMLLATQVGLAAAKGQVAAQRGLYTRPLPAGPALTPEQMQNAIVVQDGLVNSRPAGPGLVYRLASCDVGDANRPCYFTITGSGQFAKGFGPVPLAYSETLVCGVNIWSVVGSLGARLQQNINVTWWANAAHTPVTMNWGDLGGTGTFLSYWSWTEMSGPAPSPDWHVYVATSGTAYSNVSSQLVYAPPPPIGGVSAFHATRLTINSGGWYCS